MQTSAPPPQPAPAAEAGDAGRPKPWTRARRAVLGDIAWSPPSWLAALLARIRQKPGLYLGSLLGLIVVGSLSYWLITRPKPVIPGALAVELHSPELTDYDRTPPKVDSLRLSFSDSAAPIKQVGSAPVGVALSPELKGAWTWEDDKTLVFTPSEDWPVKTQYSVELDPKQTVAPKVVLQEHAFEFETAPFKAEIANSEFYQDPQDPALKKAVFELKFSHPVDETELQRRIALKLADGASTALAAPKYTVTYDERRLKAWVHSEPLTLPENGGTVVLDLAAGVPAKRGGTGSADKLSASVRLPSLYSVNVSDVTATLVENERFEPEQVLALTFNNAMRDTDVAGAVHAWLLPTKDPRRPAAQQSGNYSWSQSDVDEAVLKAATVLPLSAMPTEREYIESHSFKFQAPPGRRIYLRVNKGLKAFGGFMLGANYATVQTVPEYPKLLRFVGDGALLSLRGERRISVVSRNVPAARLEIARVLPDQIQHLVFNNNGSYDKPTFYNLSADSLVEREEKRLVLPAENPAKAHYEGVDLGQYLKPSRRGVFLLSLRTMSDEDRKRSATETLADDAGSEEDTRLIVLTDLGIVVKQAMDGRRDVFVQSLANGTPVAGARVRAVARNGETLIETDTDASGRAQLPSLTGFKREKQPAMLTVSQGEDYSFLPIDDQQRKLDYSRFDIGGEPNDLEAGALNAFLFSDRGLYRPGDTINIGMIVRAADWKRPLTGLPLEWEFTDPRGNVAKREKLKLSEQGFESASFAPSDSAPSGTWQIQLFLLGRDDQRTTIGSTSVQVREFAPDTMKVSAKLSSDNPNGWIKPEQLSATVDAENLFGTPAQQRRVEGTMVLRPYFPSFAQHPGYQFFDPQRAKEGYDEALSDQTTNADGKAEFKLDLTKYERATYQLSFLARAFEPGSGRSVAAQTTALVSNNDFLVGIKPIDDLNYVKRGAKRALQLLSIGQDGKPKAIDGLHAVVVEKRYVSVLTKQDSGLYRYVSHERRYDLRDQPVAMAGGRQTVTLPTDQPGDFLLEVRGSDGKVLNQIGYRIAGAANLSRSLERNAELSLTLSKPSYKPGETIEISIRAPYAGSGLITLERDKVYAHAWFRADSSASVQKITVPADFEGNGYINVQFLRDPNSDEIYMSPLSYGVAPFAVDRSARTQPLTLDLPKVTKPGTPMTADVTTDGKARVVLFAVDEGILQVARYRVGEPLDHFFRKKALQVDTAQILDLLLPEFSRIAASAAPGGDGEGGMSKHLNPFKRKSEKPAVWWSGIVDVDGAHQFKFTLPDHFNGKVRVVAVAVTPERIGVIQRDAIVRGDFVLTPTVPTHVAPGDEFDLPVGVANTIEGAKSAAQVAVSLQLPPSLTLVGAAPAAVSIAPRSETTVRFRVRAGNALGALPIGIQAASGSAYKAQRRIELSLRPALVARQDLIAGRADKRTVIQPLRSMYDQHATRQVSASVSPLVALDGLTAYLGDYPHQCSEQLLSGAFPALVLQSHPELGKVIGPGAGNPKLGIIDVLRSRQNSEGGIGLWTATPDADDFVTGYAALYLLEARDRGQAVPDDLLRSLNSYLEQMAADRSGNDLASLRSRALAVYLLVRQGRTASNLLSGVHEQIKRDQPTTWENDVAGLLIASSYQLLQQDKAARPLANKALIRANRNAPAAASAYADYYDNGIDQAWTVYLLNRHFAALAKDQLKPAALERLLDPLRNNSYNTLSSALTVLAMDAYAGAQPQQPLPVLEAAGKDGKSRRIGAAQGSIARGGFAGGDLRLWVAPGGPAPAWYLVNQSGFDRALPKAVQDKGLEVIRDYLDDAGKPIAALKQGQEVTVRLRVRALGAQARGNIAVVDLLPGGFEPVMQYAAAPTASDAGSSDSEQEGCEEDCGDSEGGDEDGQPSRDGADPNAAPQQTLALPGSTFTPEHVEQREDRIVLYGDVGSAVTEFKYKVRANNSGKFVVPPVYAESMYERSVYAQGGPAGELQVAVPTP
ncbi:alpha-2-macroglobulin family protein [Lysobacter capsici]|uniref:alpha-2-macroglobulin family protein n=1 Tax=Lysobacter capsici TaxID=435897 RepID=UPI001C003ACF|nr:alpha-2-macroglobulin [Lysobacter capsici]QWF15019.1 alpha-2-macroglobulin family protein [Lysobacter capsici]